MIFLSNACRVRYARVWGCVFTLRLICERQKSSHRQRRLLTQTYTYSSVQTHSSAVPVATAGSQSKWKLVKVSICSDTAVRRLLGWCVCVWVRPLSYSIHSNQFKWWRLLCKRLILNSLYSYALVTCQHVASMNRVYPLHEHLRIEWNHFRMPLCVLVCVSVGWVKSKSEVLKSHCMGLVGAMCVSVCVYHIRTLLKMTKSVHYLDYVVGIHSSLLAHFELKCLGFFSSVQITWRIRNGAMLSCLAGRRHALRTHNTHTRAHTKRICWMKNGKRKRTR